MSHRSIYIVLFFLSGISGYAQELSEQQILRGSITPGRAWWDLSYYHLDIEVRPDEKYLSGKNTIRYKVLDEKQILQVDLQPPMKIEKVTQDGQELEVKSKINAHFVTLKKPQKKGAFNEIIVYYSGHPREAVRAPWDGGFSWDRDGNGKHFIATSCQGLGASVWWPNKDHMYDEVDSMAMSVTIPKNLMDVSNGRLRKIEENERTKTFHWFIGSPINNYGVNVNIADYVHFGKTYQGEAGPLTMDFYVLPENLEKAKTHFQDATKMMKAFEHWFGPYPFYKDSYKLVEVPYLGMEHQSSVTYGNKYLKGYLGQDLSNTGWGMKFDFIIIHESGHEWFANNITNRDTADMWIHEGFTAYSENLFLNYWYGKKASEDYVIGTRKLIGNQAPVIGRYNANETGADMYYKGANILHNIRQLIDNDEKWREILRGLNGDFYHQTVTTAQIEEYISIKSGIDLSAFFDQYLRKPNLPVFEYVLGEGNTITYRYTDVVDGFSMPLRVFVDDEAQWLYPTQQWKTESLNQQASTFKVDRNFYLEKKELKE